MEEIDGSFGFLVHDIARQMTSVMDKRLSKHGLTRSHWRAVLYIWRTPGISQTELSEILDVSRMGVTGLLDRMERKGLVLRKDDPSDRRMKRIYLTDSTQELIPMMTQLGGETMDDFLTSFSKKDREALMNLLLRVKLNGSDLLKAGDSGDEREGQGR
jgi:MarR family transcriptional regulator for hemolysin